MPDYTTKDVREDHVEWVCNNEDFFVIGTPCGHKNPVELEACNECKTEIMEGAEALDKNGKVIGKYKGDDLWEYEADSLSIEIKVA